MKRKNMEAKTKETPPVEHNKNDDDDDDEEEMNAFFTLVRNIRDAHHNQMMIGSQDTKEKVAMKSTWIPSFQWEDFAAEVPPNNNTTTTAATSLLPSSSSKNNNDEHESNKTNQRQDLDLNLSL
ncbi:hypothetical protein ES319_A12G130500v1 [Gossypium barbadense]|uniref:Uncharacterized protein n=3 Tax=Gossypium TaxID=3633 RepID=A0A5J5TF85_GOSBA|nr:hypothetical protein ES319_A12G130500v1 [Gossypium barbadense]TYG89928.1 hypothetical protein ES288_A12G141200v1 [Gossypium darwinii]TYH95940.1 hypothetical protein ES332_A12G142400v1 [Gossypium tomentosum]